jgi:hypothetical protein
VRLPSEAVVFKFYSVPETWPEEATPDVLAYRPNNVDVADARRKGHPVRLSVWDRAKTTVSQARAFRNVATQQDAWALKVSDVIAVAAEFDDERVRFQIEPLQVVEDPDPDLQGPGSEGHSGIEGLSTDEAKKRVAKLFFKRLRLALAQKAERIPEAP